MTLLEEPRPLPVHSPMQALLGVGFTIHLPRSARPRGHCRSVSMCGGLLNVVILYYVAASSGLLRALWRFPTMALSLVPAPSPVPFIEADWTCYQSPGG